MGVNEIIQIINSCGFPIVMCGIMAYLLWDTNTKNLEMSEKTNEAINNNTIALTKLLERESMHE